MSFDAVAVSVATKLAGSSAGMAAGVVFCATYFPYIVALAFVAFAFRERRAFSGRFPFLAEGFGAALLARVFVEAIRLFVHRVRPFISDASIQALLLEKTSYSFPSGHAAFFFALSAVVFLYNRRLGLRFYIASIVIGLARVMAGVHYFTDILGGAILGIAVGWWVHRFLFKKHHHPSIFSSTEEGR